MKKSFVKFTSAAAAALVLAGAVAPAFSDGVAMTAGGTTIVEASEEDPQFVSVTTKVDELPEASKAIANFEVIEDQVVEVSWDLTEAQVAQPGQEWAQIQVVLDNGEIYNSSVLVTVEEAEDDEIEAVFKNVTTKVDVLPEANSAVANYEEIADRVVEVSWDLTEAQVAQPGQEWAQIQVVLDNDEVFNSAVMVTVEESSEETYADKYELEFQNLVTEVSVLPEASEAVANYEDISNVVKVSWDLTEESVSEAGEVWAQVKVKFSDGSVHNSAVMVTVEESNEKTYADKYELEFQNLVTEVGVLPEASEAVANYEDVNNVAKVSWDLTEESVSEAGEVWAQVKVEFSDGSVHNSAVMITVEELSYAMKYDIKFQNVKTEVGVLPEASEAIANFSDIDNVAKVSWDLTEESVSEVGEVWSQIKVEFIDGSVHNSSVLVTVEEELEIVPEEPSYAMKYELEFQNIETKVGVLPEASKAIANFSDIDNVAQAEWYDLGEEDVQEPGTVWAQVNVNFIDGSSHVSAVQVLVKADDLEIEIPLTPLEPSTPSKPGNGGSSTEDKEVVKVEVHGIPNDVKQVFDDKLAEGEIVVDVIGYPGLKEVTYYADGTTSEKVLEEPLTRVERVGVNKDLAKSEDKDGDKVEQVEVKKEEAKKEEAKKEEAKKEEAQLPETGETTGFAAIAAAAVSLFAGLGFIAKKED